MVESAIDYRFHDQQVWEEDLDEFVPERMFDAHSHLYYPEVVSKKALEEHPVGWGVMDVDQIDASNSLIYPGRDVHSLYLGVPWFGTDIPAYTLRQAADVKKDPLSRMSRLVSPGCSVQVLEHDVKTHGFVGLKPYRWYSVTDEKEQCRIKDFLLDEQLELADELGLWISMHLPKSNACADEWNLKDLEGYTKRYKNLKWILCHCARSFTYWPMKVAIDRLRAMPNIWYDLSGTCDIPTFMTLFKKEKLERLFYGADLMPPHLHGTYLALGLKLLQCGDRLSHGHFVVWPMDHVQVQIVGLEAPEAALAGRY